MDFKALITSLEAGDTEKALTLAKQLEPKFEQTINELNTFEGKLADAVSTRDKTKGKIKTLVDVLGITEDDLTPDKVKELIKSSKSGDDNKAEIDNLTKLLAEKDATYQTALEGKDNLFKDKLIEIEIAKIGINSDVVNDKALSLVVSALKEGATLEDGHIVYKDGNVTDRNGAGRPKGVAEKMEDFKADASNAFLFKATNSGGGGSEHSNGLDANKKFTDYNGAELSKLNRENPAEYKRLRDEHYKQ